MHDLMSLARDERADLVDLLEQLTPEQWEHPTLCPGWQVRHVVAHMFSFDELSLADAPRLLIRARFNFNRVNDVCLAEHLGSPAELTALARRCVNPRGLTAGFKGAIALLDGMIHQQDIRRPLNLPRTIPAERLRPALDFAKNSPAVRGFRHRRGVLMIATDVTWSVGSGPQVQGPGEALLMAIAGRGASLGDLSGPGVPVLQRRLS